MMQSGEGIDESGPGLSCKRQLPSAGEWQAEGAFASSCGEGLTAPANTAVELQAEQASGQQVRCSGA